MTVEQLDQQVIALISDARATGKMAQCDLLQLRAATGESCRALLPLMRALVRAGRYRGAITINKVPILLPL